MKHTQANLSINMKGFLLLMWEFNKENYGKPSVRRCLFYIVGRKLK